MTSPDSAPAPAPPPAAGTAPDDAAVPIRRSLVIPMFDEAGRIGTTLGTLASSQFAADDVELVLVDDGSTDATATVAKTAADALGLTNVRILRLADNCGKGAAVREGMLAAVGDTRVFVDADLSVSLDDIERCFVAVEDGADVAYGTRAHPDSAFRRTQPVYRVVSGRVFNRLLRLLGLTADRDTQCGLKGFRADVADRVFAALVTNGFAFDVEALARADRAGYSVQTVPVNWAHVEASRVRAFRDGIDMARAALNIRRTLAREARTQRTDAPVVGAPEADLLDL